MIFFALLLLAPLTETDYTQRLAKSRNMRAEVVMPDETRCDLVSSQHAIEVEWAAKWREAPAQATLYSIWTVKKPGIILLVKDIDAEKLDVLRCRLVCERLNIKMEVLNVRDIK